MASTAAVRRTVAGIDNSFDFAQRREPRGEFTRVSECGVLAEEAKLTATLRLVDLFEEASAKEPREHAYRWEESRLTLNRVLGVERQTTSGHMPCT